MTEELCAYRKINFTKYCITIEHFCFLDKKRMQLSKYNQILQGDFFAKQSLNAVKTILFLVLEKKEVVLPNSCG